MQMHEHVLSFRIPSSDSGEVYIDIAKAMSQVNRKLYRQQGLWHVHGVCVYSESDVAPAYGGGTSGTPYTIAIGGAPRTWVTRNALVKGFEAWKDQQKKAYDASSSSIKPKWQDFKVWLNNNHKSNGSLQPISGHMFGGIDLYDNGEWEPSKIVYELADAAGAVVQYEPQLHILGADNGTTNVGLIKQYALSRATVQSPDPILLGGIEDNIYAVSDASLGDQVEEIIENLEADNNEPPYSQLAYPGGSSNGNEPILYAFGANASTAKRKLNLNGFSAPNGLIEIQYAREMVFDTTVSPAVPITLAGTGELWLQLFVSHREAY